MMPSYGESDMTCLKYLILALNCVLMMTGMLVVAVASTIIGIYSNFSDLMDAGFMSPSKFLLAIGAIILMVSALGCIGALKGSVCVMNMFTVALSLIFIFEIAAGIAGFALQSQIQNGLCDNFESAIKFDYSNPSSETHNTIDLIQEALECCGARSPLDWAGVLTDDPSLPFLNDGDVIVPSSCCGELAYNGTMPICVEPYVEGCLPSLLQIAKSGAVLLTIAAFIVAFIQILAIYFSMSLAKAIRRVKCLRIQRQMEIRSQLVSSYEPMSKAEGAAPVVYLAANSGDTTA